MSRHHGAEVHGDGDPERILPGTPLWDALYPEHIQRYDFVAERARPGCRVLDAGCGVGYGSAHLADKGAASVVAVDLSPQALAVAKSHFDRPQIEWISEDCQTLPEASRRAPFDLICCLENIEHLPDPDRFVSRAVELLRPDGVVLITTPNRIAMNRMRGLAPASATSNPFHFREFAGDELREFLLRHFEQVTMYYQTLVPATRMDLEPILGVMWQNPMMRVGRFLQRAIRRWRVVDVLDDLLPTKQYQILATPPGPHTAITLLAECRGPRRPRA